MHCGLSFQRRAASLPRHEKRVPLLAASHANRDGMASAQRWLMLPQRATHVFQTKSD